MPKIVKNGRTYGGSSPNSALYTSYDNTGSTLDSTNVQSAISELDDNMQNINPIQTMTQQEYDALPDSKLTDGVVRFVTGADGDDINASNVVYDNTTSHLTSTNVQGAIDALNSNLTQLPKCKIIPYGTFYIGGGNTSATWSLTDYGLSASNVDAIVLGSNIYANNYATSLSGSDLTITTNKSETSRQHFAVVIYYH